MMCVGKASPTMAPTMAMVEAIKATGIARRKLARLDLSNPGPAAKAPESATSKPNPPYKIQVEGEETADDRNKKNSAADSSKHCDDPHQKGHQQ
jgi:hypothetical protein